MLSARSLGRDRSGETIPLRGGGLWEEGVQFLVSLLLRVALGRCRDQAGAVPGGTDRSLQIVEFPMEAHLPHILCREPVSLRLVPGLLCFFGMSFLFLDLFLALHDDHLRFSMGLGRLFILAIYENDEKHQPYGWRSRVHRSGVVDLRERSDLIDILCGLRICAPYMIFMISRRGVLHLSTSHAPFV